MAFEELLQLLSKKEAVEAKQDEVVSVFMLATGETLASDELTPGDPEWKAIAARAEAFALKVLGTAAAEVEASTQMADEYAARTGGEAVAETCRRMAARTVALRARAEEFAALMREVGALTLSDSDSESDSGKRCRYLGPDGATDGSSPTAVLADSNGPRLGY